VGVTISRLSDRRAGAGDVVAAGDDRPCWLAGSVPPGPLATRRRRFGIGPIYIKGRHFLLDIEL